MTIMRKQKSIEEQLAEARDRKAKLDARLQALSVKKRQQDNRLRGQGEKTLLRLLLQKMQADPGFRIEIEQVVGSASLRADEQKAIGWLMNTLTPANAPGEPPEGSSPQWVA